ncbi:MAG: hypothetical protein SF051_10205 [Elusimicrobiota bacterium]|nr:hypothetical protein [Elusimicrobiota bacterium]
MKFLLAALVLFSVPASAKMDADETNAYNQKRADKWAEECKKLPVGPLPKLVSGGVEKEFAQVAEALSAAKRGDAVALGRGVYAVNDLTIPAGVTLRGAGDETVLGRCTGSYEERVFVRGGDAVLENLTVSRLNALSLGSQPLWVVGVGAGMGLSGASPQYQAAAGQPRGLVFFLFCHTYAYYPSNSYGSENFYVSYDRKLREKDRERSVSAWVPKLPAFKGYEEDAVDDYRGKALILPEGRAKKFLDWYAGNPGEYEKAPVIQRELLGHVLRFVLKQHPGLAPQGAAGAGDDDVAKVKARLDAGQPLVARYLLEQADIRTRGARAAEIAALRDATLEKGLGRYACSFTQQSNSGNPLEPGETQWDRYQYVAHAYSYGNKMFERLRERYPIMRLGQRSARAAGCQIALDIMMEWRARKSGVTQTYTSTMVETDASRIASQNARARAAMAAAAADRAAARANMARWDNLVATAQQGFKSMYDHRTRVEDRGGDKYLVIYRDLNPGAAAANIAAANRAVASANAAANAANNAYQNAGNPGAQYREERTYQQRYSRNFRYRIKVDFTMTENGQQVFGAQNPTESMTWGVGNCFSDKVGTPYETMNTECNNPNTDKAQGLEEKYYERYVTGPLEAFLGLRWTRQMATAMKEAERTGDPHARLEGLLTAALLGAPITDSELAPLTAQVLGASVPLKDIIATILKD